MSAFDTAFELTIGHEGGYTNGRNDRGNWTSGVVGKGTLKGTKYGISAMAYPNLDIKNLTLAQAKAIYELDYWRKAKCGQCPPALGYLLFDASVNHGISRAVKFLQLAVGVTADGNFGPKTLQAVLKADPKAVAQEFCVQRMLFYTNISTWKTYRTGWTRRLVATLAQSVALL